MKLTVKLLFMYCCLFGPTMVVRADSGVPCASLVVGFREGISAGKLKTACDYLVAFHNLTNLRGLVCSDSDQIGAFSYEGGVQELNAKYNRLVSRATLSLNAASLELQRGQLSSFSRHQKEFQALSTKAWKIHRGVCRQGDEMLSLNERSSELDKLSRQTDSPYSERKSKELRLLEKAAQSISEEKDCALARKAMNAQSSLLKKLSGEVALRDYVGQLSRQMSVAIQERESDASTRLNSIMQKARDKKVSCEEIPAYESRIKQTMEQVHSGCISPTLKSEIETLVRQLESELNGCSRSSATISTSIQTDQMVAPGRNNNSVVEQVAPGHGFGEGGLPWSHKVDY